MGKEIKKFNPLDEIREAKKTVEEKMITLILGAFGLVAALAWNEAIKSLFETYFKKGSGLAGKFGYAVLVTIIAVLISLRLKKISAKKK